ncbi:N-acetylgalactosamine-6-sulfatase-like protein [Dinothrombium tinctorium]|uniref:N-acetylgalactosamine-6-sulfatase-like protein n=1 Tax=Dinothrombium tinctorium TaxID=1965070 RepID=A0A3S4QZH7_9ACAR|nr:N-acetylgalactosamine-6-sulfatase-like protein [Dinothrombium tinctorium]
MNSLLLILVFLNAVSASQRPNIIIMLMDDMGFGDLGINGEPSRETPHLDRMAEEGMLFTDFYTASPLCSPSRAALLTGRLPIRNGFYTTNALGRNSYTPQEIVGGISDWEMLLPEILAQNGYYNKIIGKWHLGHQPQYLPLKHGFHEYFGSPNCHFGPYDNVTRPNIAFFRNDLMIGRYFEEIDINKKRHISNLTEMYVTEAIEFINRFAKNNGTEKPFFLYWNPDATHAPTYRSQRFAGKSIKQSSYGDAVIELDYAVGKILHVVKSNPSLANNTFIFFTSDNGAALVSKTDAGSNAPFLCGKQTTFEGGFREPAIAWWQGRIQAKSITHQPATVMDLFATILEINNLTLPRDREYDSLSLTSVLFNNSAFERPVFYYRGNLFMAIRYGHFKAHFYTWTNSWKQFNTGIDFCPGVNISEFTSHILTNHTLNPKLFHISRDPSEKYEIKASSQEYKSAIAKLKQIYKDHTRTLNPGKPVLNWCDRAVMHWSPPGCESINKCLNPPQSKPYLCDWPH